MLKKIEDYIIYVKYTFHRWFQHYYPYVLSKIYGLSIAKKAHHTICVEYIYEGKRYTIYIPHERKYMNKMINTYVNIICENSTIKITQQPGIPFLITPKHLGASHAIIHTLDSEKRIESSEKIEV